MKLNKIEKVILTLSIALAGLLALPVSANAMHIMEGYLPFGYSIAWSVVCIPVLVVGVMRLRRLVRDNRRTLILLAMSGAFVFVISSLKIPSVTGSCSHMTGTGLAAILFGIGTTSILGVIVLVFQAILLAHGGLTTLGANTFSMAIVGPVLTVLLYKAGKKLNINKNVSIFIAVALGSLFTYCVTAVQLALAHPGDIGFGASLVQFLGVFAPTQLPLSLLEGILTVLVVIGMEKYAAGELSELSFIEEKV